jgi:hypothetical protein
VGLGKISYSLYLVHWPVIVFYKYMHPQLWQNLQPKDYAIVIALMAALALLQYRWIETPLRRMPLPAMRAHGNRVFLTGVAICGIALAIPAAIAHQQQGWPWRFPKLVEDVLKKTYAVDATFRERAPGCTFAHFEDFNIDACVKPQKGKINILLLGDSLVGHSWIGLHAHLPEERYNLLQLSPTACSPGYGMAEEYCNQSNAFILDYIARQPIDLIIMGSVRPIHENLRQTLRYMKAIHKPVIMLGLPFIFKGRLPDIVTASIYSIHSLDDINAIARANLIPMLAEGRDNLAAVVQEEGVEYYDIEAPLCGNVHDLATCNFLIDGGLITADNHHLTPAASTKIYASLAAQIRAKFEH